MESSNIKKLFDSRDRIFEIPSYQRAYAWKNKQIEQFIDDLKNAGNQYYLGHFLFERKGENTLLVIDGQQRLTTCIIFFSTLYQELSKREKLGEVIEDNLLEDIIDYYLKDRRKQIQKFMTVEYDKNFFIDEIIERKEKHSQILDTSSKKRIKHAKELFEKEFLKNTTSVLIAWFHLIENATITQFEVTNKTQATQVFAFQNDRGVGLLNLEVIKAYFMLQIYLSHSSKEKIEGDIKYVEDEMKKIYYAIERIKIGEDEVLNYYWRAISGKGYYSGEIIPGIKEKIGSIKTDKTEWIKEFISGLYEAYHSVEIIENSEDSSIKDLHYLNNMALSYPFLIKAFKIKADGKKIRRLAKFLENITFRALLRGGRADIESRLNHFLIHFYSPEELDKNISEMLSHIQNNGYWGYWNNNSMISLIGNGFFYQNRVDNYLLWKYELYLCDENHPLPHKVSFSDLIGNESIEHIAPQTPTNGNPVANGYGIYEDKENPEEGIVSGFWLNCVGNLMLISRHHNSSIGNKAFDIKLQSYGRENLLNQQREIQNFVSDKANPMWDKAAIEKRHNSIIDAAKKIWSLEGI